MSKTYNIGSTVAQYFDYEFVGNSATDQALGASGGKGDFLQRLVITVATANAAAVLLKDGDGSNMTIMPNSPGNGIGPYSVEINAVSKNGAWKISTSTGSTLIAVGMFTD